ncbi:MAG TPA: MFS transporter, partial [Chloroflexi bacterium]|nr:MFS transporter [Chloroflexota bacterium]
MLMVNQIAAMMAFTTVENRQGAYAMREAMTGFGIFAGMLVGGMLPGLFTGLAGASLDHPAPYRCALWVAVVMALIGLVPLWMIRPAEVVRSKDGARKAMPPLLPLILLTAAGLLTNGAVATCRAFASAYLDRVFALPPSVTGAVSSVGQILAVPASLSVPYLARRHRGSDGVMIVASFGLTAFLLLVGLGRWWGMAGLGIVGVFALSALWTPAYQILQMEMSAPEWRATVAGA